MRIPLDYYRILGLPIQATTEQLRQAHRDRTLQLPRREYSDAAIASRKKLLDEAFSVLANPEQRQAYDASFLAKTYDLAPDLDATAAPQTSDVGADAHTPSIEIQPDQFLGALLILQDLGEYELVLRLGRPFLTGGSANLKNGQFGDPNIVFSDIVLTVALACMELGREQWQQRQYENAAEALETGQQLLLREGLFAEVRGEIQADLYKLRPYRILELLALPEEQTTERYQGMQLLQDMLQERDGIDGSHNDQSGLSIDDFLRFIQQLRGYLTAAEQQVLFEQEAQRPSAVATYLAVYALLAKGFADRQPALVRRAKLMLTRLSGRQDVHLEQAVGALLLGQTEEASQALELSQEYGPIAFIREHSQGSPDLLPGLCLYSERWLQDEVFPHFRDLMQRQASLKDYFADPQVQAYLEELPAESTVDDDWMPQSMPFPARQVGDTVPDVAPSRAQTPSLATETVAAGNRGRTQRPAARETFATDRASTDYLIETARAKAVARMGGATATADRAIESNMPRAERVTQPPGGRSTSSRPTNDRLRQPSNRSGGSDDASGRPGEPGRRREGTGRPATQSRPQSRFATLLPWLLPLALIAGVVILGFAAGSLWRRVSTKQAAPLAEQPNVMLDRPLVALSPSPNADAPSDGALTVAAAEKVIQSWLAAKADAMGAEHKTDALVKVLAEPKLSEWQGAAAEAKRSNQYRQYEHEVKVSSVTWDKASPDRAKALATVSESTEYYEAGQRKGADSSPNLRIEYSLERKDGQWRIQNWQVLR